MDPLLPVLIGVFTGLKSIDSVDSVAFGSDAAPESALVASVVLRGALGDGTPVVGAVDLVERQDLQAQGFSATSPTMIRYEPHTGATAETIVTAATALKAAFIAEGATQTLAPVAGTKTAGRDDQRFLADRPPHHG